MDQHMDPNLDGLGLHGNLNPVENLDQFLNALEALEILISEGKKVPLTNQFVINRDSAMAAIQAIRDNIDGAVAQANNLLVDEARIREDADNEYNSIIAEAEARARKIGIDSKQQAEKLMADAQTQADQMYNEVKDQADQMYADAQRQAAGLVAKAEADAAQMVAESAILAEADREATRLKNDARAEAQRVQLKAAETCDKMYKHAEDFVIDIANKLRNERSKFERNR